ncbi:MAG: hypothetical protein K6E68_07815 [Lachnospiraceae bacterium]|nr:hypothetical protein [Lachnospiraceae bacterium]
MKDIRVLPGNPYPLGAYCISDDAVNLAVVCSSTESAGVILYDRESVKSRRIPYSSACRVGNINCMRLENIDIDRYYYSFYEGDREYPDPHGRLIIGNERWGKTPKKLKCGIVREADRMSYETDKPIMRKLSDSVFYLLHVRGFTRHSSSGVKNPGTFDGVAEKIPYLKKLGVTAIELMPAYEYIELEVPKIKDNDVMDAYKPVEPKLNYWGYKKGFYFAPKASFAAPGMKATDSFKAMVSALHKAGMELVMQFYFPKGTMESYIIEVLKFWVHEYHVDGFHLMGENIPITLIAGEPMFANTKLIYYGFAADDIYGNQIPRFKNLAICNDEYMYDIRRFLKSDEGMIRNVISDLKYVDKRLGRIHYITSSNGFTLMDLVSYDRKHNEANGENNKDGNPYNASWNCGFEGPTSRKAVNRLRRRQIRNAITFNALSQSAPLILMGDEFGNSQKGNNNPYCIDGPVTWLNWHDLDRNKDIYDWYHRCIKLRKAYSILHMDRPFAMSDFGSCGFPDLSLHGDEAWKAETDDLTRHFAIMYATAYADIDADGRNKTASDKGKKGEFIYMAVNMHWSGHSFALPKIGAGKHWKVLLDTYESSKEGLALPDDEKKIVVRDRSIVILLSY